MVMVNIKIDGKQSLQYTNHFIRKTKGKNAMTDESYCQMLKYKYFDHVWIAS